MVGVVGDELPGGDHERGHAALHVGGATAIEHAIAHLRPERIAAPCRDRATGHHVGMAEQHQYRRAAAVGGPQVVDLAQAQVFALETGRLQAVGHQLLAAGVVRRHRRPRDQVAGQLHHIAHRPHAVSPRRSAA